MSFLLQPVVCNEVLRYMIQGLDCTILCGVAISANYIPNIVARSDPYNNSVYFVFPCDIVMFSLFAFGSILLSLCGLWSSLVIFPILWACRTIIDWVQPLCVWCPCGMVSQNDIGESVFNDDE